MNIYDIYMNMYDLHMNIHKSERYLSFMLWTSSNLHELVCSMHLCEQLYIIYRCVFYETSVKHRTTSLGVIILWKIGLTCISLVMVQWINIQEGGRNISLIVSSWNTCHKWKLKLHNHVKKGKKILTGKQKSIIQCIEFLCQNLRIHVFIECLCLAFSIKIVWFLLHDFVILYFCFMSVL